MIEFKADCGHTIRVEDRHAGKIVKCAYCGREVETPTPHKTASDILLAEVDLKELARGEGATTAGTTMTIQGQQRGAKHRERYIEGDLTPSKKALRIVLILSYVAVGMIVLVVLILAVKDMSPTSDRAAVPTTTRRSPLDALPTVDSTPAGRSREPASNTASSNGAVTGSGAEVVAKLGRQGQDFSGAEQGVFVEVFSRSASIYLRSAASEAQDPLGTDEQEYRGDGPTVLPLQPGNYRIGVAMDLHDSQLEELPGYEEMREELEFGGDVEAASNFFAHDISTAFTLLEAPGMPSRLVRYYDLNVGAGNWCQITSLFIPAGNMASIAEYLPDAVLYSFDEESVRRTLSGAGVPVGDLSFVIDMLQRCGQIVYSPLGAQSRVFEINPADGSFATRTITFSRDEPEPEPERTASAATPANATSSRSPWGRRGAGRTSNTTHTSNLADIAEDYRNRLAEGNTIEADGFSIYLVGGAQHTVWLAAQPRHRIAMADLITKESADACLEEIGDTMLVEVELDVRLALLQALVRSENTDAVKYIDLRVDAMEEDPDLDLNEARQERAALQDARKELTTSDDAKKRRSPWG